MVLIERKIETVCLVLNLSFFSEFINTIDFHSSIINIYLHDLYNFMTFFGGWGDCILKHNLSLTLMLLSFLSLFYFP